MSQLGNWIRYLPITLAAMLGGTLLIACNPGFFWDDWVWIFQSHADSIRIGRELGVFWGGYLTNLINDLPEPALTMRIVALVSWNIAGAMCALILHRRGLLTARNAFLLFLLHAASHLAPIRFLTSVAMYNVYIALFWIAAAVLLLPGKQHSVKARWLSLPLFFVSFYLNSLIVLFFGGLALLAVADTLASINRGTLAQVWVQSPVSSFAIFRKRLSCTGALVWTGLKPFIITYAPLIALPFIFVIVKRLTTARSDLYGDYNAVSGNSVFSALFGAIATLPTSLREAVQASKLTQPFILLVACLVSLLFLLLLPRKPGVEKTSTQAQRAGEVTSTAPSTDDPISAIVVQLALGWFLFAAALYPYLLVDKAPKLTDFYDSRNILPAVPGLMLVVLGLFNLIKKVLVRIPVIRKAGPLVLFAYVLGTMLASEFTSGLELWRDWFRQTATIDYLKRNTTALGNAGTFIFNDTAPRIGNRLIWNYEYTGNLVSAFGTRDRFGIAAKEYAEWPFEVNNLSDPRMRRRYNFGGEYDYFRPHVVINVAGSSLQMRNTQVLSLVGIYLHRQDWHAAITPYFRFSIAREFTEIDNHTAEFANLSDALQTYHDAHGAYPVAAGEMRDGIPTLVVGREGHLHPLPVYGDIPGLFPDYTARPTDMTANMANAESPGFMYLSDGADYKLLYLHPRDFAYAKQSRKLQMDMKRHAYGVWTDNAADW